MKLPSERPPVRAIAFSPRGNLAHTLFSPPLAVNHTHLNTGRHTQSLFSLACCTKIRRRLPPLVTLSPDRAWARSLQIPVLAPHPRGFFRRKKAKTPKTAPLLQTNTGGEEIGRINESKRTRSQKEEKVARFQGLDFTQLLSCRCQSQRCPPPQLAWLTHFCTLCCCRALPLAKTQRCANCSYTPVFPPLVMVKHAKRNLTNAWQMARTGFIQSELCDALALEISYPQKISWEHAQVTALCVIHASSPPDSHPSYACSPRWPQCGKKSAPDLRLITLGYSERQRQLAAQAAALQESYFLTTEAATERKIYSKYLL